MLTRIRTIDKGGYPIFRVVDAPVIEKGDTLRLQNYTMNIFSNFKWAFKCHEDATEAVRRHKEGAKGMDFGSFVGRVLSAGAHTKRSELDDFKEDISSLLDKLDSDNPVVQELKKKCYVEKDPNVLYERMFCSGS